MKSRSLFAAYVELTKPRIAVMVLVMTALGFYLGADYGMDYSLLAWTLLGTGLAGGGASVLNQYLERDVDGRMNRTKNRPLPSGQISPQAALSFGVVMVLAGCFQLIWTVNLLAAFLALQSTFLYVLVYTPMKRLSWLNTSIGAIPGAIPPLIGWAGASNHLSAGAWVLFAILYIWQHPHFFAIAWMYREDYARGGFRMLPVVEPDGRRMFRQVIGFSLILIPVSMLPVVLGYGSWIYTVGVLAAGLFMLWAGVVFTRDKDQQSARRLLRVSLVYLPALLALMVVDRVW